MVSLNSAASLFPYYSPSEEGSSCFSSPWISSGCSLFWLVVFPFPFPREFGGPPNTSPKSCFLSAHSHIPGKADSGWARLVFLLYLIFSFFPASNRVWQEIGPMLSSLDLSFQHSPCNWLQGIFCPGMQFWHQAHLCRKSSVGLLSSGWVL